ncbi:OLC1v1030033C2 [Oldenlandia corymbosa var. corymbosa]|nr:OLC1v1030033C2 [Oldenlandia corymbosa var. corymbosa]
MPRSSRHKSHKQSKHSSKEAKEYYSDSDEDYVRMKEKDKERSGGGSKDEGGSGAARVSKDSSSYSASGEKRKLSSSSLLKDGKDLSGNGNGDAAGEEYISSKRRKDKFDVDGKDESMKIDYEKGTKSKESGKGLFGDSKSKSSSKRHESGSGEKEDRSESRRKSSEKESGRKEGKDSSREVKEREREKKGQESKRDSELLPKKQGLQWDDSGEERQGKKGRENNDVPVQEDFRNLELEKELEKRIRRRREGSGDRDKGLDARESDEKYISLRGDHSKDGKYKDEKYKDGFYGDKNQDEVEKDDRHRDVKYREDADKDAKYRDVGDRDYRYDKYREDGDKENRRREDKYREDGDRETRRKDDKYREDGERDSRRRDDKYREDGERDNKRREDKYRDDGDKNRRRNDEKHYEDLEKDDKYRDDKYREDTDRYKDDKRREDYERDIKQKDGKLVDDGDREKRSRDGKYKDEHGSRDRAGDKSSDVKRPRDDVHITEHSLKSGTRDASPTYDDRSRLKDDQVRKRKLDKEDYGDTKSRSAKDQRYDADKRSASNVRVDLSSERRSASRNTDLDGVPSRSRPQGSPSSGGHVTRDHYRLSKHDESKYREYAYEDRSRHAATSGRDYPGSSGATDKVSSSRAVEMNIQKDDIHSKHSPGQLIDKSPSSINVDRRHVSKSDVRRSIDVEEQRSGGSRDAKDYFGKEGRGNRVLPKDPLPGDDHSQAEGDNLSVSSPFVRPGHFVPRSHVPPFRTGVDGPSNFGAAEDDNRMKFNNRHRNPNLARVPGSPWNPSWPPQIANGFMPFQHAPSPVAPHLVMPQFSPHLFNVRSSMEFNSHGVPYHIPDSERFGSHVRPMWRNSMDDSYPPLHVWDPNNAPFGEEPHVYARPEWDHSRPVPGGRGVESNSDMWKGPKGDTSMDSSEKESRYTNLPDGSLPGQTAERVQIDENQTDNPTEISEPKQYSDPEKYPENETKNGPAVAHVSRKLYKDNLSHYHVYLSKLDISADLADPELYSKCTGLIDVDQKIIFGDEDSKVLYVQEAAENDIHDSKSRNSPFTNIGDSIFQKAITLYKKQREEFVVIRGENPGLSKLCIKAEVESDLEMHLSDNHKVDNAQLGELYPSSNEEVKQLPVIKPKLEDVSMEGNEELDEPVVAAKLELDEPVVAVADDLEKPEREKMGPKDGSMTDLEPQKAVESSVPSSLMADNHVAGTGEDQEMADDDIKCEPLVLSSTEGCEVVMTESIDESGSVNLSRIHRHHHHSPESTH